MSISPEMNTLLESKMKNLKRDQILRSGRSFNDFVDEFSGLLAKALESRPILEATGLQYTKMDEYNAILEKMVLVHGERIAAEGAVDEVVKQYREEMPKAKDNKKILSAILRYIIARTDDNDTQKMYDIIRKGHSQMDTLNDIISMVNVLKKYPELCSEVKPGGNLVDDTFLEDVHQKALNLVALKGQADIASHCTNDEIDRLNRIVSLAVATEREIKLFAEIAFYDDIERYNKDYASSSLRLRNKSRRDKESNEEVIAN